MERRIGLRLPSGMWQIAGRVEIDEDMQAYPSQVTSRDGCTYVFERSTPRAAYYHEVESPNPAPVL